MTAPAGTVALDAADLDRVIARHMAGAVESAVAAVVERHMPKPEKLTTWQHIKVEWTKPAGLIPAVTFFVTAVVGGIATYNAVTANTSANAKQALQIELKDESAVRREIEAGKDRDAKMAAILDGLPRTVERVSEALDAEKQRQKEELAEWRGWRKGVDQAQQEARDVKGEVGRLTGRADAQDQRSSRIFDTLSAKLDGFQASLSALERAMAVLTARDEARPKRQSNRPPLVQERRVTVVRFIRQKPRVRRSSTVSFFAQRPYFRGRYWASLSARRP